MLLDDALNRLACDAQTPRDKLLAALEMYDDGVAMQRLTFQRRFPELTATELERKIDDWLAREDEQRAANAKGHQLPRSAYIIIRESSDSPVVVMKSIQYRKRNGLSNGIGQGDLNARAHPGRARQILRATQLRRSRAPCWAT